MVNLDLFIIGVEKAGTTALFRHIAQSPLVYSHSQREMFYFLSDDEYQKGWGYALEKYFFGYKEGLVVAKNIMQINSREAMLRLKEQCPHVKCVIMLREPAARAYSAYNYAVMRGAEDCATFEEALELENKRSKINLESNNPLLYLSNSIYAPKVQAAFEIYGRDHVLVIYHDEYKSNPRAQLNRIEAFIGHSLFKEGVEIDFKSYNRSAKARFPLLAKLIYRLLQSKTHIKRLFRSILPHDQAVKLRHAILNFNRVEAPYLPVEESTVRAIKAKLASDREELIQLVGYCPWK